MIPDPPPYGADRMTATKQARERRKELGIVYTPREIAHYIIGQTLGAELARQNRTSRVDTTIKPAIKLHGSAIMGKMGESIANLRVLDPACGEGVFLLEVAFSLDLLTVASLAGARQLTRNPPRSNRERIATNNLFGYDTDAQAVSRTCAALADWVETGKIPNPRDGKHALPAQVVNLIKDHVKVTDALGDVAPLSQFDVVVGNPPYVTMTSIAAGRKEQYSHQFESYHANGDLYYLFLERAFNLLKPGGQLGVVVPRYFLKAPTAERLRSFLATKTCRFIDDLGQFAAFPGVGTHVVLLFFENRPPTPGDSAALRVHRRKSTPNDKTQDQTLEQDIARQVQFVANQLGSAPWAFSSPKYTRFIAQARSKAAGYLAEFCTLAKGVQTGKDAVFVVDETTVAARHLEAATLRPWVKGRDITPYRIESPTSKHVIFSTIHEGDAIQSFPNTFAYLLQHHAELQDRSRVAEWYQWRKGDERVTLDWASPKIVGRYKGHHPVFALDTNGAYFSQDVVLVQPKSGHEPFLNFFLALLNSPVVARIAKNEFKELAYRMYEWYPQQLAKIPVILPPPAVLGDINSLVIEILENPTREAPKVRLNDLVTTLYGQD